MDTKYENLRKYEKTRYYHNKINYNCDTLCQTKTLLHFVSTINQTKKLHEVRNFVPFIFRIPINF